MNVFLAFFEILTNLSTAFHIPVIFKTFTFSFKISSDVCLNSGKTADLAIFVGHEDFPEFRRISRIPRGIPKSC
jgi:hypothetical protein